MNGSNNPTPIWLFGVSNVPFGVGAGFASIAMPFFLRRAGVPVDRIAAITAITLLPSAYQFLWAPLIDLGPRRRSWLLLLASLGGVAFGASLQLPLPSQLTPFVVLAVLGSLLTGLVGSCNGGLMATTLPDGVRGRASGYYNVGNLGGAALGAGATLWLAGHVSMRVVGLAVALLVALPSLSVLAVDEPRRPSRALGVVFSTMAKDVWAKARSRAGWTGIVYCLSPVGTAALTNLFSALGTDFHASTNLISFTNGLAGGLVSAAGSLVGGFACDRMNRRLAYALSGALTAACGIGLALAPLSPDAYLVGTLAYLLAAGFCYAAFSAVVLEIVGAAGASAATQYTLFTAAGNQAIAYTTWLDGLGYRRYGPRGPLAVDAAANLIGIGVLVLLTLTLLRLRGRERAGDGGRAG